MSPEPPMLKAPSAKPPSTQNRAKPFSAQVYAVTKKIPRGRVATYGMIAALVGKPGAARAVGNALHHNPYEGIVPCHRVVNSRGELAKGFGFGGREEQALRLLAEGVAVIDGCVDLEKYLWRP